MSTNIMWTTFYGEAADPFAARRTFVNVCTLGLLENDNPTRSHR